MGTGALDVHAESRAANRSSIPSLFIASSFTLVSAIVTVRKPCDDGRTVSNPGYAGAGALKDFQLTFVSAISIIGYWTFVNLFQGRRDVLARVPAQYAPRRQV